MSTPSIIEALREIQNVQTVGVHFADDKVGLKRLSYGQLVRQGRLFADGLRRRGLKPGEAVILVMTNPENAITAILGCMIASCPPAPIYPPQNLRAVPNFLNFVKHVALRSNAAYIVADSQPYSILSSPRDIPGIRGVKKFESILLDAHPMEIPDGMGSSVAFLQFTSGSTSSPKECS